MSSAIRAIATRLCTSAVLGLAAFVAWLGLMQTTGNVHAVIPGELYRSAQVTPARLAVYRDAFDLRSVINLRGRHPGSEWYDAEVAASAALGLEHYDFTMSATREINAAMAESLIQVLAEAPKPALIHCLGGADRSGLAAALYVAAIAGGGEEAAERQLSPFYGHIGVPGLIRTWAMDRSFEALEPWLGFAGS